MRELKLLAAYQKLETKLEKIRIKCIVNPNKVDSQEILAIIHDRKKSDPPAAQINQIGTF